MKRRRLKTYLAALLLCVVLLGGYVAFQAASPDRELTFVREVPSSLPLETLDLSLSSVANWSKWFFTVGKVERIDIGGRPLPQAQQVAEPGAVVRVEILPHKGEHRGSFDLLLKVTDYLPRQQLTITILGDQSLRISRLFEHVQWKIELVPGPSGNPPLVIRGTETATTRHWRARLFGALSERILMNQIFYPDLMALGQFTQPSPPNPFPAYGQ